MCCLVAVATAAPQLQGEEDDYYVDDEFVESFSGSNFKFECPEKSGLFADKDQCDLYYRCEDGVAETLLCPDGELFDNSQINREKCVLPYNVDCGDRKFVQAVQEGIDPRCKRANGYFEHEDENVCDKYYLCNNGTVFEQDCPVTTYFDVTIGNCKRRENLSPKARKCEEGAGGDGLEDPESGFRCPGRSVNGPTGILQAHPIFPHPKDCQFFYTCFFGKQPNKFGCSKGQVFDDKTLVCKKPEEVPICTCWYECDPNSACPTDCNADCSCPTPKGQNN